ncbi:MAG: histidine phosphatase family protein [Alphaproteobacteria bacterium]|nr:histidine phosphatase family protein [Alphaproteobacteria bacterium]
MRQLTLLRHAKAEPGGGATDFERSLNERGRSDASRMGWALIEAGVAPDVVLISSSSRTRQTWEQIARTFPGAEPRFLDSLYLAPPDALLQEAEAAGAERVMIIAHNPGLQDLAADLGGGRTPLARRIEADFPTAAAALFERKNEEAPWRLLAFLSPKDGSG